MTLQHNGQVCAQRLADALPIKVSIINYRDEIVFMNDRFNKNTSAEVSSGFKSLSSTIHLLDYDRVAADYRRALRTRTATRTEYRARDDADKWRALTLTPMDEVDSQDFLLRDNGGMISLITDITPQKQAELLQKRIAEDARERKTQQERFIDMISHEVRNPLSAILHCVEDIMEAVQEEGTYTNKKLLAAISEAAETINLCVVHQKKIIDDVLIYSKLDASMLNLLPQLSQPTKHLPALINIFQPELRRRRIEFDYMFDESYARCGVDWIIADLDRMGQVLINLIHNAIKFTSEAEGERKILIHVGASAERPQSYPPNVVFFEPTEAALRLDSTTKPEWGEGEPLYLMVAVRDTGVGISEQNQNQLFDRFKQATPRTEGTYGGFGLGLNISQRLCHMHGGEIGVRSREGQGSTFGFFFTVRRCANPPREEEKNGSEPAIDQLCYDIEALDNKFPCIKRDLSMTEFPEDPPARQLEKVAPISTNVDGKQSCSAAVHSIEDKAEISVHQPGDAFSNADELACLQGIQTIMEKAQIAPRRRVLLVEDNIINQQIVARKLKKSGFDVTEASNGQEALEACLANSFDCILMDQEMPVMDGNSATKKIRAMERDRKGHIPIIGVTANVRQDQQTEMLEAGMDNILHKPYKMQDLCEKVRRMIELRLDP
ncbi:hypothetical protein BJX61DRAFT_377690 [Aspergillus egyptiacus]|nr:hypothetical protein BJX61DRAFT_377690 [Aspergillus egyptiacus]